MGSAFDPALWGRESNETAASVVTAERFLFATDETVTAISPDGEVAWEADVTGGPDASQTTLDSSGYPALRVLDGGSVVAFARTGKAGESGLTEASAASSVVLLDAADGSTLKTVDIPGDGDISPAISKHGLGFTVEGSGESTIVHPDGTTETADGDKSAVVGNTVLTENRGDWQGPGWKASDLAPKGEGGALTLVASDDDDLLILEWSIGLASSTAVVQASTGKVIARPECKVPGNARFSYSPDASMSVVGPLRIQDGEVECFGGGEGEKDVDLRAVTDDGTSYGVANSDDNSVLGTNELLTLTPDGKATTEEVSETMAVPVGVMTGNIVINVSVDPTRKMTITANPVT